MAYVEFGRLGWARNQLFMLLGNFFGGAIFVATAFQGMANRDRLAAIYRRRIPPSEATAVNSVAAGVDPELG